MSLGSSLSLAWTLAPRKRKVGKGIARNKLDSNVLMLNSLLWLPENISFECSVHVLFRLNCYMALIQVSMISLQSNITQKLDDFKSCNTFSSTWLLVGFLLLFVFMYLFCLYQSMGMCIWWTSSLALWISNLDCSPACQSIVLISQKIFIMKQERFFFYLYISETVFSSDVVRSLLQDFQIPPQTSVTR